MDTSIEFDRRDGSAFQITAGTSDLDGRPGRQLVFGVPGTDDEVALEWPVTADFSAADPVPVRLRIGTLSAQRAVLKQGEIVATEPAHDPPFGPNAEGILRAVADALDAAGRVRPDAFTGLRDRLSTLLATHAPEILFGKVPRYVLASTPASGVAAPGDSAAPEDGAAREDGAAPEDGVAREDGVAAPGPGVAAGAGAAPRDAAAGQPTEVTMRVSGKVPRDLRHDAGDLAGTVAQYAAAGVALGTVAAGPTGAAPGGLLGALVGVTVYLAG